jgi:hypothetical protein
METFLFKGKFHFNKLCFHYSIYVVPISEQIYQSNHFINISKMPHHLTKSHDAQVDAITLSTILLRSSCHHICTYLRLELTQNRNVRYNRMQFQNSESYHSFGTLNNFTKLYFVFILKCKH